jgi:CheY-like chemotaxis protein
LQKQESLYDFCINAVKSQIFSDQTDQSTPHPREYSRERLLLVEDDANLRRHLRSSLERLGYRVDAVSDGAAALSKWRSQTPEERPQAVLTDIQMPHLGDLELIHLLRQDDAELPIIVLTTFSSGTSLVQAIRLHADDFVPKPVEVAELKAVLDRALQAKRQRTILERERTRAARLQAVLETATAVNHEINNPLATISASAQLLRSQLSRAGTRDHDEAEDADTARLLDILVDQCERIAAFNRKLNGVVNPVTRTSGGQLMLDVEQSR